MERSRRRRAGARSRVWSGPLPYAVATATILLVVAWSVVSTQRSGPAMPSGAAAEAVVTAVTSVPPATLDAVGSGGLPDPLKATGLPQLQGASGRPVVVYVGAEYCPFCASERWSLIVALSRFGRFSGLGLSTSSSTDVYPNTPTFTFTGSSYQSGYLELSAVETADREARPIASLTSLQKASFDRSDPSGSIPFLSIADRYVAVGSGFSPDLLQGRTWSEIASALSDPSSPIAKGILGNANRITDAICKVTQGRPASACSSR